MIETADVEHLPASAQDAIKLAADRVERAASVKDTEATIGSSKELVECVAKAALDALGGAYGSNVHVDKLASEALAALKRTPAFQGRAALDLLGAALINVATAIAQLRNTDGTGHGRASRSNLDAAHAEFVRAASFAWCRWVLASTRRALKDRAGLERAILDIGGAKTFGRGSLAAYLADLAIDARGEDDQRKVGLAVARRWSENGTFMPVHDVIEPIVGGTAEYPPAFCEGLLEGLLLNHDGFLIMTPDNMRHAIGVSHRLPGSRLGPALDRLADRVDDARPSPTFGESQQDDALVALRSMTAEEKMQIVRDAVERIARRVEHLRGRPPSLGT